MEVAAWLYGLGLGRYEQRSENDIDGDFLMDLTAENLIGLGVASGRLRKLLAAALRPGSISVTTSATPVSGATTVCHGPGDTFDPSGVSF